MGDELKYLWQQAVLDAFVASRDALPVKINIAQRTISARLTDGQEPDLAERVALRDAMRALRVLALETKGKPDEAHDRERKDTA